MLKAAGTIDTPARAMVVTPHPDDAELGCAGTVARWIREGAEVFYLLCTNGDKGSQDPGMTSERLAAIRAREQEEAARVLGVKGVIHLGYADGELEDTKEFRGVLVRAIRMHRPDVVLTTDFHRRGFYLHRDHRICGQAVLDAVFPYARDHLHYPEQIRVEGLQPHKVGDVLFWGAEEPDTFVDITDTIALKVEALKQHASQVFADGSESDLADIIRSSARRMGQRADLPYAEAFRRIQFRR
jgi:LmbE family N-acetylglucosaminyl deacetylase